MEEDEFDMDYEVARFCQRNPESSYCSMKSSDQEDDKPAALENPPAVTTELQLQRSDSPATQYTETTLGQQSVRPREGVFLLVPDDTRWQMAPEDEVVDSPIENDSPYREEDADEAGPEEPPQPEPLQPECTGLHPELKLPHIFKMMQDIFNHLSPSELKAFKAQLRHRPPEGALLHPSDEGDTLDVVDIMLEHLGKGAALKTALRMLAIMDRHELAEQLESKCRRAVIQHDLKCNVIRRNESIYEGVPRPGKQIYLKVVYTEPQISMVWGGAGTLLGNSDVFKPSPDHPAPPRVVLTAGIPMIGLSVAVQKFCLDWAQESANPEVQFVFPLPFCELNRLRGRHYSLMELLVTFFPETKHMDFIANPDCTLVFVFDGLDVFSQPLDFQGTEVVSDIHAPVPVESLLVNLLRGSLLPGALLWITSRRAAACRIPAALVQRFVEVVGFTDVQKDDYLTRRFPDKDLAIKVLRQAKRSPTLYAMAQLPLIAWMVATVFQRGFQGDECYGDPEPTLTSFYTHYVIIQTNRSFAKYQRSESDDQRWQDEDRASILALGKLALRMLERDESTFSEKDLAELGLNVEDVVVTSGLCTERGPASCGGRGSRVFCFVHLTVQEYLAALYTYLAFRLNGENVLAPRTLLAVPKRLRHPPLLDLYRSAVERALRGAGRMDLFLRFLCGLTLESSNGLIRGLLVPFSIDPLRGAEEVMQYLHDKIQENACPERCRNLVRCVSELNEKESSTR